MYQSCDGLTDHVAEDPQPVTVHKHPLSDVEFSSCGRYLHGTELEASLRGKRVILSIEQYLAKFDPSTTQSAHQITRNVCSTGRLATTRDEFELLASQGAPRSISSNKLVFTRSNGQGQVSILRQYHQDGAVVLRRLYEDGTVQEECLARLPLSGSLESSYASLLAPFDGDGATRAQIQLILNKATQDSYSCSKVPDIELPALYARNLESIPSWSGKRPVGWCIEEGPQQKKRK